MLYTATDSTRIDFTVPSDRALHRIIVDPDVKSVEVWLGNKRIEQLATYIKGAKAEKAFTTPSNLTTSLQCSANIEASSIWSDFVFNQVGNVGNQAPAGIPSTFGKIEKLDPLPVSHYMSERESHMIEQWAGHVVEATQPNDIVPDTPVDDEGPKKVGRSRRVKKEDDDEDEGNDDRQDLFSPVPLAEPRSMSDALNLQYNAQKAKVGRTRIKKIEEDDEEVESEDGFQDRVSVRDTQQSEDTWTYTPLPGKNNFRSPKTPSGNRPGTLRQVREDSDDEVEGNGMTSPIPDPDEPFGWDQASPWVSSPVQVEQAEISNDWDAGIYPQMSSFNGNNAASKEKQRPVDPLDWTKSQNNFVHDARSDANATLTVESWSNFANEAAKGDHGNMATGWGRNRSRGNGKHDQRSHNTPTRGAAQSHGRDKGNGRHNPQTSHREVAGSSSRRNRGSRGSGSSTRTRGRGTQSGRGDNKFGVLAVDTLVDISESEVGEAQSATSPPGYKHSQRSESQVASADKPITEDLIDISASEDVGNRPVPPPPGYGTWTGLDLHSQVGSHRLRSSAASHRSASASVVSQNVPSIPNTGEYYVNTQNPGMNLIEMSRRRIEQLQKARQEEASRDTRSEHLQEDDEASTRTYHRTMNQQAKKPQQKKKEAEQKKAELLQNAWGTNKPSSQAKANTSTTASLSPLANGSDMSAAKKKLLRTKEAMAQSDSQAANEEQITLQNDTFIAALTPVLKAARAFPGSLKFEVQLGQFLSPSPEGAYQPRCVTVNQWHKLYDSQQGRLAPARTFTNILTRNGADVDHILKLRQQGGGGTRLFQHDNPGRFDIRFEFHCQGKHNDEFKLVINPRGEYRIERPFRKIGQVNLHVPAQVWDAAGLLTGSIGFPEEQALKDAADELAKSIYIPQGRKEIEISYLLPSSNEFAVKRVVMRRVSRHMCAIMDKNDVQLQITEVQRLYVERRSSGTYCTYASAYDKMVEQMMIHFEVSLISESIERALAANADLAVGDVTSAWTADSLLQPWRTRALLEVTHMVLSKSDGVGFHNVGSAVFFLNQNSVLGGGSAVAFGTSQMVPVPNQQETTALAAITQNAQAAAAVAAAINVPGVRGGVAQPHVMSQGYALGYGGAKIPLPGFAPGEGDAVVPDDSASQAPGGQGQVIPGFW